MSREGIKIGDLPRLPYPLVALLTKGTNPNLDDKFFPKHMMPKQAEEWIQKKNRMKGKYLGACLDAVRWGSMFSTMYEMSSRELISFISNWMMQNKGNLKFHEIPTILEVPHFQYDRCPRCESTEFIKDLGGRVRCAHHEIELFKPNFVNKWKYFDEFSATEKIEYNDDPPVQNFPNPDERICDEQNEDSHTWEKEKKEYETQLEKYKNEKESLAVTDFCYAAISDYGLVLSLEDIIDRKNISGGRRIYCKDKNNCKDASKDDIVKDCSGHTIYDEREFPFDGWTLAWYVEAWYNQEPKGKAPLYRQGKDLISCYKRWAERRNFRHFLSTGELIYNKTYLGYGSHEFYSKLKEEKLAFVDSNERKEWENYVGALTREYERQRKEKESNPFDREIMKKMLINYGIIDPEKPKIKN